MATRRRKIVWAVGGVIAAAVLFVVFCRTMQHHHHATPERVAGSVLRERNFFTDLYGARVGGQVLLFDAGVDDEGGALDRLLAALEARREDVSDVYLTHGHFDHVAAAPLCTKARIHVGAPDVAFMAQKEPANAPIAGRTLNALMPIGPVIASDAMTGRPRFTHGAEQVVAIPTPGHTAGSFVFLFRGVLFVGDAMVIDGDRLEPAMPLFAVDAPTARRSVVALGAALKELLGGPELQMVCTGHMGCTPPGQAQRMFDALVARIGS